MKQRHRGRVRARLRSLRRRLWRRLVWRQFWHTHLVWERDLLPPNKGRLVLRDEFRHAHLWPHADHDHQVDLPCLWTECDTFPPHRLHPKPPKELKK